MDVISRNPSSFSSSTLNPNAPMFVPSSYREVEDFSDEWWALVQSSPWFRDYWLQECFHDPQNDDDDDYDYDSSLPDLETVFYQEVEQRDYQKDLVSLGALKWRNTRVLAETPRYAVKAPKIVNVKVSPRQIQQPR